MLFLLPTFSTNIAVSFKILLLITNLVIYALIDILPRLIENSLKKKKIGLIEAALKEGYLYSFFNFFFGVA